MIYPREPVRMYGINKGGNSSHTLRVRSGKINVAEDAKTLAAFLEAAVPIVTLITALELSNLHLTDECKRRLLEAVAQMESYG